MQPHIGSKWRETKVVELGTFLKIRARERSERRGYQPETPLSRFTLSSQNPSQWAWDVGRVAGVSGPFTEGLVLWVKSEGSPTDEQDGRGVRREAAHRGWEHPWTNVKRHFYHPDQGHWEYSGNKWELKMTTEGNTGRTPENLREAMVRAAPVTTPSLPAWKLPPVPSLFWTPGPCQDRERMGNGLTPPWEGALNDKVLRREQCVSWSLHATQRTLCNSGALVSISCGYLTELNNWVRLPLNSRGELLFNIM